MKKVEEALNPTDISEQYIKRFLLNDALLKAVVEQFHNKEYKQMTHEQLKEFRRQVIADKELTKKVKSYLSKNPDRRLSHFSKTIFGFDTMTKRFRSKPLDELNKIKNALYVTMIYDVISLCSFYVGILLIAIYTIIKFIR